MAGVCRGDKAALEGLLRRHQARVLSMAYRLLGDWHLAEDVAQETFLRLHRAACTYRPQAKFTTWLYRIVYNLAVDQQRRRAQAPVSLDAAQEEPQDPSEARAAERGELAEQVQRAISRLPERQRRVLLLHRYEDLGHADIAQVTGWSPSAVESLLVRAYAHLREELKGVEDSIF